MPCVYIYLLESIREGFFFSIASLLLSSLMNKSIKTSEILRKRCNVTMMTWSIGIKSMPYS